MQYKIPQEISTEDKLIGTGSFGLSLRQLIIVGAGGGIAYMMYISLVRVTDPIVYIPPMAVILVFTLAVAFFRKDNLSFTRMMILFLETAINPAKRVWVQMSGDVSPFKIMETYAEADVQKVEKKADKDAKTINDIGRLVEILDYNDNDEIQKETRERGMERQENAENSRSGFLERFAQAAAQKAAEGVRKPVDLPQEQENLYIKPTEDVTA